jgi:beta-lactamase class A
MSHKDQELIKKVKSQKVIILILIIVLVTISLFFIFSKKETQTSNQDFKLLDPLRKFTAAENYLTNIEDLRTYLRGLGEKYPDSITIYYENINSGSNISVNKDLRLFPASLSKLVQAILIAHKVEKGDLSYDQILKVEKTDLSSESGNLYKTILNKPKTTEELLEELIVNSDNTAQNIFKHYLNAYDYIDFQNVTGLQDLYNEDGFISAKEYTRILRVLYTSNFLKPENSEKILNYMANSTFKDYLSQGIPEGVVFAHKYGENIEYNIFADSGIVYVPKKPYMISVIIKGKDSSFKTREEVTKLMKEISIRAYSTSK